MFAFNGAVFIVLAFTIFSNLLASFFAQWFGIIFLATGIGLALQVKRKVIAGILWQAEFVVIGIIFGEMWEVTICAASVAIVLLATIGSRAGRRGALRNLAGIAVEIAFVGYFSALMEWDVVSICAVTIIIIILPDEGRSFVLIEDSPSTIRKKLLWWVVALSAAVLAAYFALSPLFKYLYLIYH
jgi:hypothetical protein